MRRRPLLIGGIAAVVLFAIGAFAVWLVFFRDDAPDAVSIEAANEQLDEDLAAEAGDAEAGEPTTSDPTEPGSTPDINRVWTVDKHHRHVRVRLGERQLRRLPRRRGAHDR